MRVKPIKVFALLAVICVGSLLLSAMGDFPAFGDPNSPANAGQLATHYITQVRVETKVPNIVTAVLADYRGFDTMFETVVILVAGLAILAILRRPACESSRRFAEIAAMKSHVDLIQVTTCRLLIPVIQLFALYVIAHGHHSPGGGFQGGVILGASFILMALVNGLRATLLRFSEKKALFLSAVGVIIFAGTGLICMLLGGNFLDYEVLHQILPYTDPVMARSHAMLIVEIGVAFTVMSIMFLIYAVLSSGGEMEGGL